MRSLRDEGEVFALERMLEVGWQWMSARRGYIFDSDMCQDIWGLTRRMASFHCTRGPHVDSSSPCAIMVGATMISKGRCERFCVHRILSDYTELREQSLLYNLLGNISCPVRPCRMVLHAAHQQVRCKNKAFLPHCPFNPELRTSPQASGEKERTPSLCRSTIQC